MIGSMETAKIANVFALALTLKARDIARETPSVPNRGPSWVCPNNEEYFLSENCSSLAADQ